MLPIQNTINGLSQLGLGLAAIKGGSDLIGGGLGLGGLSLVDGPASPATATAAAGAVTVGSGMVVTGVALVSNGITILMSQNQSEPGSADNTPSSGNLKRATNNDLQAAARADGYSSVEAWKQQELQLNSRSDIVKDADGNLFSIPRQGGGSPQPLGVKLPR